MQNKIRKRKISHRREVIENGFFSVACLNVELPPFCHAAEKLFPQGVLLSLDTDAASTL